MAMLKTNKHLFIKIERFILQNLDSAKRHHYWTKKTDDQNAITQTKTSSAASKRINKAEYTETYPDPHIQTHTLPLDTHHLSCPGVDSITASSTHELLELTKVLI